MHSRYRSAAPLLVLPLALALAFDPGQALGQGDEMDFGGGGEEPPPDEGIEIDIPSGDDSGAPRADEEPQAERSRAYVLTFSSSAENAEIVRELGSALRDVLAAHQHYSTRDAENLLNGVDQDVIEALAQAREFFEAGQSAVNNLEIDSAIDSFTQALEIYEEQIAHVSDLNDISDCLINIGAAHVLAGDSRAARSFFQRVLLIDPERRPDPDLFPPPVIEAYDQASARVARTRNGLINVSSPTPGAEVFVDGIYQGPAPQELSQFRAGRHYVRVRREGFVEQGRVVEVSSRRPTELEFDLEPTRHGPDVADMLIDLASQLEEGNTGEAAQTVGRLGELLGVEMLATALVTREEGQVMVRLNAWDVAEGESVASERLGPFEPDGVVIAGDVQPSFEEMINTAYTAMNVQQQDVEQIVDTPPPPPEPEPTPRPVWRRWWFWTAIGAVVVGAGLGLGLGLGLQEGPPGQTPGEVIIDL